MLTVCFRDNSFLPAYCPDMWVLCREPPPPSPPLPVSLFLSSPLSLRALCQKNLTSYQTDFLMICFSLRPCSLLPLLNVLISSVLIFLLCLGKDGKPVHGRNHRISTSPVFGSETCNSHRGCKKNKNKRNSLTEIDKLNTS